MTVRRWGLSLLRIHPRTVAVHAVAWGLGFLWLLPFLGVLMTAIRPVDEILHGWWVFDPFNPTAKNFVTVWTDPSTPMWRGIRNSFIVAIPATVIPIFIATFAAYGFARFRFPIRDYLFLTIVLFMAVPQQMVAVPIFLRMIELGLWDNWLGVVLLHSSWAIPWIVLFMRNFFQTLPVEVEEAARVDGASDLRIFLKIVLPMALPALAAVAVLQFMWVWNDFFFATILLFSPDKMVATQLVPLLSDAGPYQRDQAILSAASMSVMIVPVVIFALLQRYYIRGMIGWTIKG